MTDSTYKTQDNSECVDTSPRDTHAEIEGDNQTSRPSIEQGAQPQSVQQSNNQSTDASSSEPSVLAIHKPADEVSSLADKTCKLVLDDKPNLTSQPVKDDAETPDAESEPTDLKAEPISDMQNEAAGESLKVNQKTIFEESGQMTEELNDSEIVFETDEGFSMSNPGLVDDEDRTEYFLSSRIRPPLKNKQRSPEDKSNLLSPFNSSAEESAAEDEAGDELDDDEIKTNPAFIPKTGLFYMHDIRSENKTEPNEESKEVLKKGGRQSRADVKKWGHDLYNEQRQQPKTGSELTRFYGYNIRGQRKNKQATSSADPAEPKRHNKSKRSVHQEQVQTQQDLHDCEDLPDRQQSYRNGQKHQKNGNLPSSRGQVRTFRRTVASSQRSNDDQGDGRVAKRISDRQNSNRRVDGPTRRANDENIPKPSGEFHNLNGAQPLPKREPRAQRENSRRQQSQNFENYPSTQENPAIWSNQINGQRYPQSSDQNTRQNNRGPPQNVRASQQPGPMHNTNVPPPRLISAVPFIQPMPLVPPMIPSMHPHRGPMQFRQPTNVVYFNTETQSPQKLAPKERRPLQFTAPSR